MKGTMLVFLDFDGEIEPSKVLYWKDSLDEVLQGGKPEVGAIIGVTENLAERPTKYKIVSVTEFMSTVGLVDLVTHKRIAEN